MKKEIIEFNTSNMDHILFAFGNGTYVAENGKINNTIDYIQFVGTYNKNSNYMNFYYNGLLKGYSISSFPINSNTTGCSIGDSNSGTNFFNGDIAIIRMHNRDLIAQEILQNFNADRSRFGI